MVKLTEAQDSNDALSVLGELEAVWDSLKRDSDMYEQQ
jgi:hypothetical protein